MSDTMSDTESDDIRVWGPGLSEGKTGKKCIVHFTGLPVNTEDSTM